MTFRDFPSNSYTIVTKTSYSGHKIDKEGNGIFKLQHLNEDVSIVLLKDLAVRMDVGRTWFMRLGRNILNDCMLGDEHL